MKPPSADGAACAGVDPELFFQEPRSLMTRDAISICRRCPVQPACLAYALEHPQCGIWGATTEDQRRDIARRADRNYNPARTLYAGPDRERRTA